MAKIRKWKLSWEASASEEVIGYKLYWSRGSEVGYDCKSIKVGNVTEIALPDSITLAEGPVMFGVTAVDRDGNESDMVTIPKPYRLKQPGAPSGLAIQPSESATSPDPNPVAAQRCPAPKASAVRGEAVESLLARAIEETGRAATPRNPGAAKRWPFVSPPCPTKRTESQKA